MKSHRKHAPDLPNSRDSCTHKGRLLGRLSPDGKKRRLDQLHQAIREWWMYFEWIEDDKARKQKCIREGHKHGRLSWSCGWGDNWFKKSFIKATERMETLWQQAKTDGLL